MDNSVVIDGEMRVIDLADVDHYSEQPVDRARYGWYPPFPTPMAPYLERADSSEVSWSSLTMADYRAVYRRHLDFNRRALDRSVALLRDGFDSKQLPWPSDLRGEVERMGRQLIGEKLLGLAGSEISRSDPIPSESLSSEGEADESPTPSLEFERLLDEEIKKDRPSPDCESFLETGHRSMRPLTSPDERREKLFKMIDLHGLGTFLLQLFVTFMPQLDKTHLSSRDLRRFHRYLETCYRLTSLEHLANLSMDSLIREVTDLKEVFGSRRRLMDVARLIPETKPSTPERRDPPLRKSRNNCDQCEASAFSEFLGRQFELFRTSDPEPRRNCRYTPDVVVLDPKQAVYCIGDLHGDFDFLYHLLVEAELIDGRTGAWIGRDSVVVQLGDILDGRRQGVVPHAGERKIVNFLKRLHLQALETGGLVVTCFGNHDVLRLLAIYDQDGNPSVPEGNHYYLKKQQRFWERDQYRIGFPDGLRENHYERFTSPDNRRDFSHNRSLSAVGDPYRYGSEEEGFHRQLLASCASKLLLKLVYRNSGRTGLLCSHGEKLEDFFVRLKALTTSRLRALNDKYKGHVNFQTDLIASNHDYLIITVNALFAFYLRHYNMMIARASHPFRLFLTDFLDLIMEHSFVTQYLPKPADPSARPEAQRSAMLATDSHCGKSRGALSFFSLDPFRSSCVSGHSVGSNPERKILTPCRGQEVVMTDVGASRAFGSNSIPQMARFVLGTSKPLRLELSTVWASEDRIPDRPEEYYDVSSIATQTSNPESLELIS
jgi:hypothetical protein